MSTTPALSRTATLPTLPARETELLTGLLPALPDLLPADLTLDTFRAALYLELSGHPGLAECTVESLRDGVIKAATYGLLPGRDCHLLPFRNRKGGQKLATFVPNYFGLILSLERTGKVAKAFAHPVYAGDDFELDYLTEVYRHVPAVVRGKARGAVRFFYGCIQLKDGTKHLEVMDDAQIDEVRRRAPAHDQGPWVDDYLMMARKTVLKRAIKYVRLTPEAHQLVEDDETREREDIPAARHQANIVALYGDAARDDSAPTIAQIEAAILAHPGGDVERWYVWAERRFKKPRTSFSVEDYQQMLQAVREAATTRRQHGPQEGAGATQTPAGASTDVPAPDAPGEAPEGPQEPYEATWVDPQRTLLHEEEYGSDA